MQKSHDKKEFDIDLSFTGVAPIVYMGGNLAKKPSLAVLSHMRCFVPQ